MQIFILMEIPSYKKKPWKSMKDKEWKNTEKMSDFKTSNWLLGVGKISTVSRICCNLAKLTTFSQKLYPRNFKLKWRKLVIRYFLTAFLPLPRAAPERSNLTLHKKWSFPLWIFSVNVTKSAGKYRFGHIYWRYP